MPGNFCAQPGDWSYSSACQKTAMGFGIPSKFRAVINAGWWHMWNNVVVLDIKQLIVVTKWF